MVYGIVLPTSPMVRRDFPAALLKRNTTAEGPYTSSPALLATATRPPGRWGCAPARGPGRWRSKEDWNGFFGGFLRRFWGDLNGIQWGLMGFQRDFHGTLMGFTNVDGILDGLTLVKISRKMVLWHDIPWYTRIIYVVLSVIIDLLTGRHPQLVISLPKLCVEENICRQKLMTESHKIARTLYRVEPPYELVAFFVYGARMWDPCWSVFME